MTLSRVASRGRRPKKPLPMLMIAIGIVLLLSLTVLGIGIYTVPEGVSKTAAGKKPEAPVAKQEPTAPASASSPGSSPGPSKLTLWPLPRVEAQDIPLTFFYEAAQEGTRQLRLQYKPEGAGSYKDATLQNASLRAAVGRHTYSVVWNKSADGVKAGERVDVKLAVTDAGAPPAEYEIRNVTFETRDTIRRQVHNYLISYDDWTDAKIDEVKSKYQMVILHTQRQITPEQVQRLRGGKDPHDASKAVLVLGYISVGEDLRTAGMTPEEMKKDPRFVLGGEGPAIDPRQGAPYPNGSGIPEDMDSLGKMTGGGFAPFYLNDNVTAGSPGKPGIPDVNVNFKAAFVNPGHPEWLKALTLMTKGKDKVSGIKELLGPNDGTGFGCDGLFLDTLDTAAPNSFTDASSTNPSEFEWVAKGTQELLRKVREDYPGTFLLANRGIFFYHPDMAAYRYTLRGIVDFVLYESFKLDSSSSQWFHDLFFHDNKYNYGQKLLAEADRHDGFKVLSLGYAEGPEGERAQKALHGEQNPARELLLDDLKETTSLGMVHYLSNAAVTDVNSFALENTPKEAQPPVWGSTKTPAFGKPYAAAREGAQKLERRGKDVYIQWDVAHSNARPIVYTLYVKAGSTFDFSKDIEGQSVFVRDLPLGIPDDYAGTGDRSGRFPYEAKVEGLVSGKTYFLVIRAKNAAGQYEENRKVMRVVAP